MAVGSYGGAGASVPLAARWNGTSWSLQAPPDRAGGGDGEEANTSLTGVSCTSRHSCVAVGTIDWSASGCCSGELTLIERWNGSSWSVQPGPKLTPIGANASLNAVACPSTRWCEAVGSLNNSALIERWNGRTWSVQRTPPGGGSLDAISCASVGDCVATGRRTTGTLAESWNGGSWRTLPRLGPRTAELTGVSCSAPTACTAVGWVANQTHEPGFAAIWNGRRWEIQHPPTPAGPTPSGAGPNYPAWAGVSCTSSTRCTAVGSSVGSAYYSLTMADRWNGRRWVSQRTPNATVSESTALSGVSCTSPSVCVAVGDAMGGDILPLAEIWSGTSWSTQRTPVLPPSIGLGGLRSVSCITSAACIAVGNSGLPVALRFDGAVWSVQALPTPPGVGSSGPLALLRAVSCTSVNACTAVGGFSPTLRLLAEGWNGTTWSLEPVPVPAGETNVQLNGISCGSPASCTAVGGRAGGQGTLLVEYWNGASWSIQAAPLPSGATGGQFNAVSCVSAIDCTAVGVAYGGNALVAVPLAEIWDGSTWTAESVPAAGGTTNSVFNGVSCVSVSSCTAVGWSGYAPLAESWDGTKWTVQATPTTSNLPSELTAVSCTQPLLCTAVGDTELSIALVERYS